MIQFNMLPDIKVEYIRTQRVKRLIILSAIAATAISIGLLLIMFSYLTVKKQHISNLDKDIASIRAELEGNKELTRILSVQNQLKSLPALYAGRPAATRLPEFIDQTTPVGVGIGKLSVDFSTSTIEMSGTAPNLELINSHIDTLKFTSFKPSENDNAVGAFSKVVLSNFSRNSKGASFTITMAFDPQIFDESTSIRLSVPSIVTTRAQTTAADLFDGSGEGDQNAEQ